MPIFLLLLNTRLDQHSVVQYKLLLLTTRLTNLGLSTLVPTLGCIMQVIIAQYAFVPPLGCTI